MNAQNKFLKKASNRMAFAKIGLYGDAGSGKTFTAGKFAIGLHQYAQLTKPVAMFDTEPAASFIVPYFEAAGIEFMVFDESRALADLLGFMDEAERECSIVIIDSITHIWREVQSAYLAKINEDRKKNRKWPITKLEFQHWGPIKAEFGRFTDKFLSSKVHAIVCGRAGSVYEYQEGDNGKKELITVGSKMASEKEMGYEPSLLIEMSKVLENGNLVNTAFVEKDRADKLNGHTIRFPSFESILPHVQFLNIGGEHFGSMQDRSSKDLFTPDGDDGWSYEKRQREIWCEEVQGLLVKHYPSQGAEDKKAKMDLIEKVFATRSWTKVESFRSDSIKAGYDELKIILEPGPQDDVLQSEDVAI